MEVDFKSVFRDNEDKQIWYTIYNNSLNPQLVHNDGFIFAI
jgi:hypothetical protein